MKKMAMRRLRMFGAIIVCCGVAGAFGVTAYADGGAGFSAPSVVSQKKQSLSEKQLEDALRGMSLQINFEKIFVGTGFKLAPDKSNVRMIAVGAGHVWETLYQAYARFAADNKNRNQIHREECDSMGRHCMKTTESTPWFLNDLILIGKVSPVDFFLFWKDTAGDGSSVVIQSYPAIGSEQFQKGTRYYAWGMNENDERGLAILEFKGNASGYLQFQYAGGYRMLPGASGSAILNASGEVVGISVINNSDEDIRGTDIRLVMELAELFINY